MTDPDSRKLLCKGRFLQGYNAQAAVSDDQVIVGAEMTNNASDATMLERMVGSAKKNLSEADAPEPETFLADAGYWSRAALNALDETTDLVLPPPERSKGDQKERQAVLDALVAGEIDVEHAARRLSVTTTRVYQLRNEATAAGSTETWRRRMRARLESEEGRALYQRRRVTVEPVFGNIKANLGFRRFSRRGIGAVRSEWRLICSTHNLLKLRQRRLAV